MNIIKEKERLNKMINSKDLDIRIKAKKEAKELGFAVIPVSNKYEVVPTKKLIGELHDMHEFNAIETLEQRG